MWKVVRIDGLWVFVEIVILEGVCSKDRVGGRWMYGRSVEMEIGEGMRVLIMIRF